MKKVAQELDSISCKKRHKSIMHEKVAHEHFHYFIKHAFIRYTHISIQSTLRDINLLHPLDLVHLPIPQILNQPRIQARFPTILLQPLQSIHAAVRQQNQVALHMALGVMRIRHVPC